MFEYKYKTRVESPTEILVMRTHKSNAWPRDELDMETLLVDSTNRHEAIREAKATEAYCWG
jgi:hypothetical protein